MKAISLRRLPSKLKMMTQGSSCVRAGKSLLHDLNDDLVVPLACSSGMTTSTPTNSLNHLAKCPETQTKMRALLRRALAGGPQDWD